MNSKMITLNDVCVFIKDGTHQTPVYADDGYIFLSSKNVTSGVIDWDDVKYIPESLHEKLYKTLKPQRNDILLAKNGTTGIAAIVDRDTVFDVYVSLAVLRPRVDLINPRYLLWAVNSPRSKAQFDSSLKGIGVPNLHLSSIAETIIPLPDMNKQLSIVKDLDEVQHGIAVCEKLIATLELSIKSRFVDMFGDPLANPLEWPVKKLKDISTLITNGTTPKGGSENYVESGIMFLRSQNVWRNRIELDDVVYIDEATHAKMKKSSLHHKDILITKTGRINTENSSLGRAALFLGADDSANINGHVYLVRLDGTVVPEFVVTILTGEAYRKYIRKVCVGGIDKRQINVDHVEDFPIIQPPYEMQEEFSAFIDEVSESKAIVQTILDKLKTLQASLMQEYFG